MLNHYLKKQYYIYKIFLLLIIIGMYYIRCIFIKYNKNITYIIYLIKINKKKYKQENIFLFKIGRCIIESTRITHCVNYLITQPSQPNIWYFFESSRPFWDVKFVSSWDWPILWHIIWPNACSHILPLGLLMPNHRCGNNVSAF